MNKTVIKVLSKSHCHLKFIPDLCGKLILFSYMIRYDTEITQDESK